MLPLIARCGRGAAQHLTRPLLPAAARGAPWFAGQALPSTSVASSHIKDTDVQAKMGATVAEAFKRDAAAAASTLASTLSPHERQVLLASLCSKYSLPATDRKAYNDALFDAADKQAPKGVLTRCDKPGLCCTCIHINAFATKTYGVLTAASYAFQQMLPGCSDTSPSTSMIFIGCCMPGLEERRLPYKPYFAAAFVQARVPRRHGGAQRPVPGVHRLRSPQPGGVDTHRASAGAAFRRLRLLG